MQEIIELLRSIDASLKVLAGRESSERKIENKSLGLSALLSADGVSALEILERSTAQANANPKRGKKHARS